MPKAGAQEVKFTPVDNSRLAALCGPVDANLRQIETALDVTIARRGERFTIEEIQLGLVEISHARKGTETDTPALMIPRRTELTARTPRQAQYLNQMRNYDITFCVGPAGTGKTFLAVAAAVDALERDTVKRIVLTRPAVQAGEKPGLLPGDLPPQAQPYP